MSTPNLKDIPYNYELTFVGNFDQSVIDNSDAPDKANPAFSAAVQGVFPQLLLSLQIFPTLQVASTFITFDGVEPGYVYKITLQRA